mgnify:CR=1 FL=1
MAQGLEPEAAIVRVVRGHGQPVDTGEGSARAQVVYKCAAFLHMDHKMPLSEAIRVGERRWHALYSASADAAEAAPLSAECAGEV